MRRLPCLIFAALLGGVAVFLLATVDRLPGVVATHFDGGGRPNGWMTRGGYLAFSLAFDVGLPLLVTAAIGLVPRRWPRFVNIPNRQHWLAPERRAATLGFLATHACSLGCLMTLFGAAVHWLILRANATASPALATAPLLWTIGAFLAALGVWIYALYRRLAKPG
jgi:hypothetical protein